MVESLVQQPAQNPAQQDPPPLPDFLPQPQVQHQLQPQLQHENQPLPQPRARRTRKDDFFSALFGKLDLRERLERNKVIEEENKARVAKTYNHHLDPISYPQPGSEAASFITIDEADVKVLKDPSIFARLMAIMPDFLIFRITRENGADKEDREKRKLDELAISPSDDFFEAKRRRIDGSKVANRIIGSQRPIVFSEILSIKFRSYIHPVSRVIDKLWGLIRRNIKRY
jgi:hypothetical protein